MILNHLNVSNRVIIFHSNVSMSFKKQHTNTLYCFANRGSLDESSNSMDEKFFLKKIDPRNHYTGIIKRMGQYKLRVLLQQLQVSF